VIASFVTKVIPIGIRHRFNLVVASNDINNKTGNEFKPPNKYHKSDSFGRFRRIKNLVP
jgi:hypothetical protein